MVVAVSRDPALFRPYDRSVSIAAWLHQNWQILVVFAEN
jgi:hypothetical protein